jgi:hypothetical protein
MVALFALLNITFVLLWLFFPAVYGFGIVSVAFAAFWCLFIGRRVNEGKETFLTFCIALLCLANQLYVIMTAH